MFFFVYMLSRLFRLNHPWLPLFIFSCPCESGQSSFVTFAQTNKGGDACFFKKKCVALTIRAGLQLIIFFPLKNVCGVLRDRENNLITRLTLYCQKGSKKMLHAFLNARCINLATKLSEKKNAISLAFAMLFYKISILEGAVCRI